MEMAPSAQPVQPAAGHEKGTRNTGPFRKLVWKLSALYRLLRWLAFRLTFRLACGLCSSCGCGLCSGCGCRLVLALSCSLSLSGRQGRRSFRLRLCWCRGLHCRLSLPGSLCRRQGRRSFRLRLCWCRGLCCRLSLPGRLCCRQGRRSLMLRLYGCRDLCCRPSLSGSLCSRQGRRSLRLGLCWCRGLHGRPGCHPAGRLAHARSGRFFCSPCPGLYAHGLVGMPVHNACRFTQVEAPVFPAAAKFCIAAVETVDFPVTARQFA